VGSSLLRGELPCGGEVRGTDSAGWIVGVALHPVRVLAVLYTALDPHIEEGRKASKSAH
jgi:hypothetical protein